MGTLQVALLLSNSSAAKFRRVNHVELVSMARKWRGVKRGGGGSDLDFFLLLGTFPIFQGFSRLFRRYAEFVLFLLKFRGLLK